MFDKKFIRQIEVLQAIKPSAEWKERTKDILLSQIRSQGTQEIAVPMSQKVFVYCTEGMRLAYHTTFGIVFARPSHFAAALSIVLVIGTGMVFVAEKSLPGDPLYVVKQTREEMGMAFIAPDQRAEAELERVSRRLAELRALKYAPLSDQEKDWQVESVVDTLSQTISTAKESLATINEPTKAISVAHAVKEKTDSLRQELGSLKVPQGTEGKLADAQQAVRATDQKALEVIVDKGSSAGLTDAAIAIQLKNEAAALGNKLSGLGMKVTLATTNQTSSGDELLKIREQAQKSLAEVAEQIDKKEFKVALEKLNASKELIVQIERRLKDAAGSTESNDARMK